jgi:hypothetical protein
VSHQTLAKAEQPVLSPSFPLNLDNETGLLTTDEVDQVFWDNDNHLYAIGQAAGKLFVFTGTPTTRSGPGIAIHNNGPDERSRSAAVKWLPSKIALT